MPLKTNIFLIFFKDIHLKSIIFLIFCPGLPLKTIIFAYLKRKSNSIFFSIIRLGLGCTFLTTKHLYLNWLTIAAITMTVHEKQERLRSTRSSSLAAHQMHIGEGNFIGIKSTLPYAQLFT